MIMAGFHRLRLVYASFFVFTVTFFTYGSYKACGVLFHEMVLVHGIDGAMNGLIFTIPMAMTQLTAPAARYLLTCSTRRVVTTSGVFLVGSGYILMGALATEGIHFVFCSVISGIGFGLLRYLSVINLHEEADGHFPVLRSVANIGGFAGIAVLPYFINKFLESFGLSGAFYSYGVLCSAMLPFGLLFTNTRKTLSERSSKENDSEDDNEAITSFSKSRESLLSSTGTSMPPKDDQPRRRGDQRANPGATEWTLKTISSAKELGIFLFIVAASMRRFPNGSWGQFLIPYVRELGLTRDQSILAATVSGIGGILGTIFVTVSFRFDEVHSLFYLAFYYLLMVPVFLGFGVWPGTGTEFVLPLSSGFLIAACLSTVTGALAIITPDHSFPEAYTVLEIGSGIFYLMSGPLAGFGYNATGSFGVVFTVDAMVCATCALLIGVVIVLEHVDRKQSNLLAAVTSR